MSDNLELPAWKRAIRMFLDAGFKAPDAVSHDWFRDAMAIDWPSDDAPFALGKAAQVKYVDTYQTFSEVLLVEHKIALASERGFGYRVVQPQKQVSWAEDEGARDLKKALNKQAMRIAYVDTSQLNDEERKQRSDAAARTGRLRSALLRENRRTVDVDSFSNLRV